MTRVLLLDAWVDEREMYAETLQSEGFEVVCPDGPRQAFRRAVRERPDVVVTRILQPASSVNGIDLTRRLKHHPATRALPVIIITTLIQPEYRQLAEDAGCDAYLLMPICPFVLTSHIRDLLRRSRWASRTAKVVHAGSIRPTTKVLRA
jgi:CheY-like chemotaxis protein